MNKTLDNRLKIYKMSGGQYTWIYQCGSPQDFNVHWGSAKSWKQALELGLNMVNQRVWS